MRSQVWTNGRMVGQYPNVFDGGDVIHVEAEVVDKVGVRVPRNEAMINANINLMGLASVEVSLDE